MYEILNELAVGRALMASMHFCESEKKRKLEKFNFFDKSLSVSANSEAGIWV